MSRLKEIIAQTQRKADRIIGFTGNEVSIWSYINSLSPGEQSIVRACITSGDERFARSRSDYAAFAVGSTTRPRGPISKHMRGNEDIDLIFVPDTIRNSEHHKAACRLLFTCIQEFLTQTVGTPYIQVIQGSHPIVMNADQSDQAHDDAMLMSQVQMVNILPQSLSFYAHFKQIEGVENARPLHITIAQSHSCGLTDPYLEMRLPSIQGYAQDVGAPQPYFANLRRSYGKDLT